MTSESDARKRQGEGNGIVAQADTTVSLTSCPPAAYLAAVFVDSGKGSRRPRRASG